MEAVICVKDCAFNTDTGKFRVEFHATCSEGDVQAQMDIDTTQPVAVINDSIKTEVKTLLNRNLRVVFQPNDKLTLLGGAA